MIEFTGNIQQIVIFVVSGLLGMLYSYCWRWVELPKHVTLVSYLFGDSKETLKVLLVFISTCAGTIGLEYLDTMTNFQIILAGCSVGLLIPQKVTQKEETKNAGT